MRNSSMTRPMMQHYRRCVRVLCDAVHCNTKLWCHALWCSNLSSRTTPCQVMQRHIMECMYVYKFVYKVVWVGRRIKPHLSINICVQTCMHTCTHIYIHTNILTNEALSVRLTHSYQHVCIRVYNKIYVVQGGQYV